jgi:hypothetical protein
VKRRRFLGMKRTESDEIVATFAQRNVLSDKARNIYAGPDFAKCSLIVSQTATVLRKGVSSAYQRIPSRTR